MYNLAIIDHYIGRNFFICTYINKTPIVCDWQYDSYIKLFVSSSNHLILHSSINMAQHSFEEYNKIFSVQSSVDQTHTFDKYLKKSNGDLNVGRDLHAKDIVTYVFGEELQRQFNTCCKGCQIDHPSQLKHSCLWLEDDNCDVNNIFREALVRMDFSYLKLLYLETANVLNLDVKQQPNFFEHQLKDIRDLWKQLHYFGVLVSAIKNMNSGQIADLTTLMTTVHSARVKLQSQMNTDPRSFLSKPLMYSNKS